MNAFRIRALATAAVTVMSLASLASTVAQADPRYVTKNGTDKAETIHVIYDGRYYAVHGKKGNDLIETNNGNDILYGDDGNDTLDGSTGDDILWGGKDKDYFRYGSDHSDSEVTLWGFDTICDFQTGDKIDIYEADFYMGTFIDGGNFSEFDTNKNGIIDKNDKFSFIQKVSTCGSAKDSLVIDVKESRGSDDYTGEYGGDYGDGTLTIYGKTNLKRSDFVLDYTKSEPEEEYLTASRLGARRATAAKKK